MLRALSAALSGLRAQQTRLSVSANNVANLSTPGFQPSRARLESTPDGVRATVEDRVDISGQAAPTGADDEAGSNVDLLEEVGELIEAPRAFEANLAVIKAADEMEGGILDVLG